MERAELEGLDRESLVRRAEAEGIRRARILTRPELVDELLRLDPNADEAQLKKARGFFGRARDLLARVVERGLHLPDAADRLRSLVGTLPPSVPGADREVVPTVTLAEIYAAQGHKGRAIETLRRVLDREPDHVAARTLLMKLEDASYVAPARPLPPEPEVEPEPSTEDPDGLSAGAGSEGAEREGVPTENAPPEVVAIPLGGGATYVWWAASRRPGLVLRTVVVTPSWDGPSNETRDLALDAAAGGELVLRGLPERAVVRVALGTLDADRFVPLAHSPALLSAPRRGRAELTRWTPRGAVPVVLDDPRAASIARAFDAARRMA